MKEDDHTEVKMHNLIMACTQANSLYPHFLRIPSIQVQLFELTRKKGSTRANGIAASPRYKCQVCRRTTITNIARRRQIYFQLPTTPNKNRIKTFQRSMLSATILDVDCKNRLLNATWKLHLNR